MVDAHIEFGAALGLRHVEVGEEVRNVVRTRHRCADNSAGTDIMVSGSTICRGQGKSLIYISKIYTESVCLNVPCRLVAYQYQEELHLPKRTVSLDRESKGVLGGGAGDDGDLVGRVCVVLVAQPSQSDVVGLDVVVDVLEGEDVGVAAVADRQRGVVIVDVDALELICLRAAVQEANMRLGT